MNDYDPAKLAVTPRDLLQQLRAALKDIPQAFDRIDYLLDGDREDVLEALDAAIVALGEE